jgi:bacillithiol biosynthesis cysteine-adding enzyme BshC
VLPQSGVSTTSARLSIDIRRFPWIRRLAADYAFDFARLSDFFAGNPADASAWREAIARTQRHARPRDAVVDLLDAQQRRRGAPPEAAAAAAQLREPKTVAVVTGQQAGLFGGPLFTLLKALTALRLAERVRTEHRTPAVAIFWIDAEDHDWDEVKTCQVLDSDLAVRPISLGDLPGANQQPVARIQLDGSIGAALESLEQALQATEFTPQVLDELQRAYRAGSGMADAFATLLESLLGPRGLVVYDAADPGAKPLLATLFATEAEHPGRTSRLAAEAGAALEAAGYHAQVTPHDGSVALFHLNGAREPVREAGPRLAAEILQHPERFSPNVLLRPIAQDALLPTVCYVAGPNELAYLAQLRRVYEAFGVPMPLVQQRTTATILDSNAMRFLSRHDFPLESLRARDEAALNALLESQLPRQVESSMDHAVQSVEERLLDLSRHVVQIDPTLEGAVRSTRSRMQEDLKKLHGKIIQAAKRKDDTLRRQYHHARAQAFPDGHSQERQVASVYFVNKYGPGIVDRLNDELSLDMGLHWVVTI